MKKKIANYLIVTITVILLNMVNQSSIKAQTSIESRLESLGGYDCPDSDFTCVTLSVPLNHFTSSDKRTIDVVFGILPATGERKGMFVIATGGPGSSGLASADSYTAAFDPSILEHFDIVFFDQRGAYQSGNLQCPSAVAAYYSSDASASTAEEENQLINNARTFAQDCVTEMGVDPERLAYYGTNQAVADLETFRQAVGEPKLWLYGESYGTQFVQMYTHAYPQQVASLILDGTVDLTIPLVTYYREQTRAFSNVLHQTLNACNEDTTCKGDFFGEDAVEFYNTLVAELITLPSSVEFPLPDGTMSARRFSLSELQTVIASLAYTETDRMMLQRALASASKGDLVPLMREFYVALGIDPLTEEAIPGSTDDYSDALYYAVECNDYAIEGSTPEERANNYIHAGDVTDKEHPDLAAIFYGDLPCAFWPGKPTLKRPNALIAKDVPTLILGATADPATPVDNGRRVYSNLQNGYIVTMKGGPHVIFGRGNICPDELVTAFLVDEKMPDALETTCEGYIADPYVPIAPENADAFENPLGALDSAYDEIYYLPEYFYGDTSKNIAAGCTYGGILTIKPMDEDGQQVVTLDNCAFTKGFVMSGDGTYDVKGITLNVKISGLVNGQLHYTQDADSNSSLSGEYNGEPIDLESEQG